MENVVELVQTMNTLSPLAIIGLLGTVIFMLVKKNEATDKNTEAINHTDEHILNEMSDTLKTVAITLQRIEVRLGEDFTYIKSRVNGGYGGPNNNSYGQRP